MSVATESRTRGAGAPGSVAAAGPRARLSALCELTKPGITRLVVLTTAAGFYLGSTGRLDFALLAHTLLGVALAASGANALNQFLERDVDARMRRTRDRPLPSGRLGAGEALLFASAISAAGLAYLLLFVDPLTTLLVAASLASYVFAYTPLKRRVSVATLVGCVPGALPIVAGWTAAGGALGLDAFALFWILFLWQIPHFLALAWIYREDYRAGGLAMLSVFDPGGRRTARQIMLYALALLPVSLLPTLYGMTGALYFVGAFALGLLFLLAGAAMLLGRSEPRARRLFLTSVLYLPALLTLMAVDKV